ncbi:zinc finger protein 512 isoform X2 [Alligator mississippiensis]|uniref:Zinc finger protein 512 isoform B n=1 Tax=Alligator mississippiensis TaxID=8496 RepID=A0A151NQZ7_ALLMI|nr:zinc finger protein 512 isoform X2 [Alligator mississippiensis]KYO39271.1 zinc finger protein 512 isoform B [Alligator mississippiensis]
MKRRRSKSRPTPHRQQKSKRTLGNKKPKQLEEFEASVLESNSNYDEPCSDSSSTSSKGQVNGDSEPGDKEPVRRSACWVEMRRIKIAGNKSSEKKAGETLSKEKRKPEPGETPSKEKRKLEHEEDEDSEEAPRKKQKVPARKKHRARAQQTPKAKGRYVQKDPPSYEAGSREDQWHLEILDKGRITCPTCKVVVRKTVEGLKKHMTNCSQPAAKEGSESDEQHERDQLRKVLKRMGKLKCTREGCTGSFTSIMGYLYHIQKCGKAAAELEKMALKCHHCSKAYKSKAGLAYHLRSEHGTEEQTKRSQLQCEEERPERLKEMNLESSKARRVQRKSAKMAIYYLHELASTELAKEWPKRKVREDLIPDDRKLKYTRPGLPTFSQDMLGKWKSDIKVHRRVHCPNKGCESVYGTVAGLKVHLTTCTLGDFVAGKYKCLLCDKEFISESGVKYHINVQHSEDWFDMDMKTTKSFEKLMKTQRGEEEPRKKHLSARGRKKRHGPASAKKPPGARAETPPEADTPPDAGAEKLPGAKKPHGTKKPPRSEKPPSAEKSPSARAERGLRRSLRGHPPSTDESKSIKEEEKPLPIPRAATPRAAMPKAAHRRGRK